MHTTSMFCNTIYIQPKVPVIIFYSCVNYHCALGFQLINTVNIINNIQ